MAEIISVASDGMAADQNSIFKWYFVNSMNSSEMATTHEMHTITNCIIISIATGKYVPQYAFSNSGL